jgi:glycerate 2-kinase
MARSEGQRRDDALAIWRAGVLAVSADRLVREAVRVDHNELVIMDSDPIDLREIDRITVVGAGKGGVGMVAGIENALGPELCDAKQLGGWVNIPADCLAKAGAASRVHLFPARPAGRNEPTEEGVIGCRRILERIESLGPRDLCICVLSGGGSALMPAPVEAITLADKLAVTRHLSGAGANIEELNIVRKQLSRIKGGGLRRACKAGRLVSLVISDVLGDPLDVIASGPTSEDSSTPEQALRVLRRFRAEEAGISERVFVFLAKKMVEQRRIEAEEPEAARLEQKQYPETTHHIIGNNRTAVDASAKEAERRGYKTRIECATTCEGAAEDVGRELAETAMRLHEKAGEAEALISGGEPVVQLINASQRGLGGRNQQLILAALQHMFNRMPRGLTLLSGGTDGEDGPTDAAGAFFDARLAADAIARGIHPESYLRRNDAYRFFESFDGLIKTGPTHTNVCDVRVVLVDPTHRAEELPLKRKTMSSPTETRGAGKKSSDYVPDASPFSRT